MDVQDWEQHAAVMGQEHSDGGMDCFAFRFVTELICVSDRDGGRQEHCSVYRVTERSI